MQREEDEYYEDNEVYTDDVIRFKEIVKTIDIGKYQHSHREYCEIVESIFQEIFNRDGEKGNDKSW